MKRSLVSALVLAALLSCGRGSIAARSTTDTPSSASPTTAAAAAQARALAYRDGNGLWIYPIAGEPEKVATLDDTARGFALRTASEVSYFAGGKLQHTDTATGSTRTLADVEDGHAMDWSDDGSTLAFITVDYDGPAATVNVMKMGGRPREVWRSGPWDGRGGSQLDEISVSWSPDGETLLIVFTPLDTAPGDEEPRTLFVIRADGSQVMEPLFGTMARWRPGGGAFIYFALANHTWYSKQLGGRSSVFTALNKSSYRPRFSPDGSKIASDDGQETPALFVQDLASDESRLVREFVSPIWLSNDSLIAAATRSCAGECEGAQWTATGTSRIFGVGSGLEKRLDIAGSIAYGADIFYD